LTLALNYSNAACASTQSPAKADAGSYFHVEKPKMSTVLQPATSGKVVLKTTVGDIDVELWPKEAPMACRNFVQLCMEGYYDNCIFHRIIRKVCAQTGDPTGSGDGGESAYGTPFDSEPHSRLRFMHRGLVAMAGTGKESNGSQFFFTLAETRWLDGKHTIFGKVGSVVATAVFNALIQCSGHG
jgi:peptidyl-prolyl cis-trans isomerase SDCCAG10